MKLIKMPVSELNPPDLNEFARDLLQKLADNAADFPAPPITDLTAHKTTLNSLLGQVASLEAQLTSLRLQLDAACGPVRNDMNAIGDWGEGVTQDPLILSKVFALRSARTPSGPTPRVTNLQLSIGDSAGKVDSAWNSLFKMRVKSYEVQTVLNPLNNDPSVGPWVQQPTVTKSSCTITGFTSGARIWVRVRGIGPNGPGD